ncbi:MAG: hypothetical protein KC560_16815, partial [Myxococcales bacterium]|nr:hypothetical protein [Myxococcales bacterium]
MLKLVYLAKRKPGFAFDDFVRRWRMHGARGMEGSFWRHALAYVQAEPLRPTPVAGTSEAFDAIAIFAVRDDAFAAMTPDDIAGAKTMAQDELETFSAPIPTTALWVDEERLLDGEFGGIAAYLFFADEVSARAAAALALASGALHRIVVNRRRDAGPFGPQADTLPYGAIVELAASSVDALTNALGAGNAGLVAAADVA